MNSWQIIKNSFIEETREGSFGRMQVVNDAADLFVKIMQRLTDEKEAKEAFNSDEEVGKAFLSRGQIKEMKEAGVIQ